MTFDQEVKLTLIGGMIILSFTCSILFFRMLDAQDQVKVLQEELQSLRAYEEQYVEPLSSTVL